MLNSGETIPAAEGIIVGQSRKAVNFWPSINES